MVLNFFEVRPARIIRMVFANSRKKKIHEAKIQGLCHGEIHPFTTLYSLSVDFDIEDSTVSSLRRGNTFGHYSPHNYTITIVFL